MKKSFILIFLVLAQHSFGQKIEKESRIESEKVPRKALEFIYGATESYKVKWYFEQNEKGNSYEAKFMLKKRKVSVEFDLKGNLEDVELEISKSKIPSEVKQSIRKFFKVFFKKYRILKVQKQFREKGKKMQEMIKTESILRLSPTFYEIVVVGKRTKDVNATEFLFDNNGNLISSKRIEQNNSDHLAY